MISKRARLTILAGFMLIATMLILVKCMPSEVSADPMGPITIETHLSNINANMNMIKWIGGIMLGLLSVISSLVVYIFRGLKERVNKSEVKIDHIEETFMSIATHDRICKDGG